MIKQLIAKVANKVAVRVRKAAHHASAALPGRNPAGKKPKIWPHHEHHINLRDVSHNAIRVCETLQSKGFEAFVVGGAVRDLVLGLKPKDFDVATNARPEQVQKLFRRARIIGRRFQIVHVMFGPEIIETTTFRAAGHAANPVDEHGRVLRDNQFGRQDEDAIRRDFTVNALYYDPKTQTVWDYHQGMEDLRARTLRMIGEPTLRYREDPVRMLRVVRFAAKLGFSIEPDTQSPIAQLAPLIANVPPSRLFDEMLKLLSSGKAMSCLEGLRSAGLQKGLFPLLDAIFDDPRGEAFVAKALAKTDARVQDGKPLSAGFLFACLLWHLVQARWEKHQTRGEAKFPALFLAMDDVLTQQCESLAIPRRYTGDMRDIWAFQPRFERRIGQTPYKLLEQSKFRAALDFLELRAEVGDVPEALAQWWRAFEEGDGPKRAELIDAAREEERLQRGDAASPKKKRRRKKKPASPDAPSTDSTHAE